MSVDDGHPLDLRMAALLERHGLRATFYLPLENCEGLPVLNPAAMRELASGFEIGSHTRSHRFLTTLDASGSWREIGEGKQLLEDCLGMPVRGFCYPGGRHRRLHRMQVRAAGFDYARSTQNLRIDCGAQAFRMPTSAQFYPHPTSVLLRNFVSQRDWPARIAALRIVLAEPDWMKRMHRLLDLALERGGVFHLWCHSVDIERMQLWSALDAFLTRVAGDIPAARRITNGELFSCPPPPAATAALGPLAGPDAARH